MNDYKLDLSNFKEEPPTPWTDEQYREAFQSLVIKYHEIKRERDTLIDDVAILKANNERLMRRNQKLEGYVRMWEKLTKWKKGKLTEDCSNDLLHELSYTMNELERDMYKGRG